jgi:hypothetical protein
VRIARLEDGGRTILRHVVDGGSMASAIEIAPWHSPPPVTLR